MMMIMISIIMEQDLIWVFYINASIKYKYNGVR